MQSAINIDYSFYDDSPWPEDVPISNEGWSTENGGNQISKQYTNTLSFNEYAKWLGNVSKYHLYRSVSNQPYIKLHTWDRDSPIKDSLVYVDVVTTYTGGNGRFCYYIEAWEGDTIPYGSVNEGSLSNISCISQTPIIFVPNAFTPNGDFHNEIFKPISYFVSEKGYSFTIYNRNGVQLFTTNDPLKGWDGSYNGVQVQDGTYVYHLQFYNGAGSLIEKKDVVTIIR